ncbi:energy transducer TonB [Pseudoalteromonas phenolica]|uniref:TonB domain protein n=2 Tax=Pseudoalteromonas phenolica TaxID=161398 RepID=A0A0S2K7V7_9GAMM|nr:energy transducer TonB [Pseudoalteromonas phenolica]ALO44280.1 TonB domain protein [Pseudoalteromonas phenolica]MBE0357277.1 hypothetical protein [Pseudoalteromonas phenolica O-BC30]
MNKTIIALSILSLSFSSAASSTSDLNAEFKKYYSDYQAAVQSGDKKALKDTAQKAYEVGKELYGQHDINTINLAINYATSMGNSNPDKKILLEEILKITKEHHTDKLDVVFNITLPLAKLNFKENRRESLDSLEDIAEQAEAKQDYEFASIAYLEAAKLASKSSKTISKARKLIRKTDKINQAHLPETSVQRLSTDIWVAALDEARNRKSAAIERLEHIVKIFDSNLDFDHPFELSAHSKLVNLYEKTRQSDKATKHCLAIAKMVPWKDSQEQEPLYRANPQYPKNMARKMKSGWVQLQFTVSTSGFVKDIEVIDSSEKGFIKASIEALEQWRYAPKFEDGKPVEAVSTVQLDYIIGRG